MNASLFFISPSRLRCFACMMYEALLLFGIIFVASYLFDALTQSKHALMWRHTRQVWLFFILGLYFVVCWYKKGQTLPMKIWGISLSDKNGHIPTIGKLILRYIVAWILPLLAAATIWFFSRITHWKSVDLFIVIAPFSGFIWSWFDCKSQFIHDRILGTRLIIIKPLQKLSHE